MTNDKTATTNGLDASLLAQITADLALGAEPTGLLQRFLEPVVRVCGAEAGAMRVLSDDGRRLELVADIGLPAAVRESELSVDRGCGVCGSAAGSLEVAWSEDLAPCAKRSHEGFFGGDCRRVLAVPLAHRGRVLGVCNLFFARDVVVAAQVTALLKTLGELLGLALHGARLERENLQAAVLAERQLMAAEVHDSVAQTLAFAKMRMPLLEAAIAECDVEAARRYCADLRGAVGDAHSGLRALLTHFRAPVDAAGFRHALQTSKVALREHSRIELAIDDRAPELRLSEPQDHQVHRIVQEALANIARHAGARHAWLKIERRGDELEIVVDDDGAGLQLQPANDAEAHFGLGIMRERAARLGGALEILPRVGGGTRVRLHFPVGPAAAAA